MTLLSILFEMISPSIARFILGRWLKDETINDISSPLIELIKKTTDSIVEQKEAQRLFETIGDEISKNLQPLFESDGLNLDNASKEAVALAVANTLTPNNVNASVIIKVDLDPHRISKNLLEANVDKVIGLSESERNLYERIVIEICEYIVDMPSRLSGFTEKSLGELLRRSSEILQQIDQILAEIRQIYLIASKDNEERQGADFEYKYRKSIIRKLDKLELFGSEVTSISREQSLSVAYVSMSVSVKSGETVQEIKVTVDQLLDISSRLLVVGEAGSGKTTLLQWIAVNSAANSFPIHLGFLNHKIPFYIPLRNYSSGSLPQPSDFILSVAKIIDDEMPKGWVNNKLALGQALVLIDGVDEIAPSKREEVRAWIIDMINEYPKSIFIVTSRPTAVTEKWLKKEEFLYALLLPMDKDEINTFINNWHESVKQKMTTSEDRNEADELSNHVKEVIWNNRGIFELASNPLLCALLCALHRDRNQDLPSDRITLYKACAYMLIERRDLEKRVDAAEYVKLSYRQKEAILESLAYWMIKNNWATIRYEEAVSEFDRRILKLRELPKDTSSEKVLNLFLDRSGMLREISSGEISFTHRTFQEFFAARAVVEEGDIGLLVDQAKDDNWKEIAILASGLAPKSIRAKLIDEILETADKSDDEVKDQYYLLAIACIYSSVEVDLSTEVLAKINHKITELIPPKDDEKIWDIVLVGNAVVPYLKYNKNYSANDSVNCIKALSEISTTESLLQIKSFTRDRRQAVATAILQAREKFNEKKYDEDVLIECSKYKSLKSTSLNTLNGIEYMTGLTNISVNWCSKIKDISPIRQLKKIVKLSLMGCDNIEDIEPISTLTELETLDLSGCSSVKKFSSVQKLSKIKCLKLTNNNNLSNLKDFQELSGLEELDLSDCTSLISIDGIDMLSSLKSLTISIGKISPLYDISKLKDLSEPTLGKISTLNIISRLKDLNKLTLTDCVSVTSLSPLVELKKLRTLKITGARRLKDFSPLEMMDLENFEYEGANHDMVPQKWLSSSRALPIPEKITHDNLDVFLTHDYDRDSLDALRKALSTRLDKPELSSIWDSGELLRDSRRWSDEISDSIRDASKLILTGSSGSGKTALLQNMFSSFQKSSRENFTLHDKMRELIEKHVWASNVEPLQIKTFEDSAKEVSVIDEMSKDLTFLQEILESKDRYSVQTNRKAVDLLIRDLNSRALQDLKNKKKKNY